MIRNRMELRFTQIMMGKIGKSNKLFALGLDGKIYYYTSKGWRAL